MTRSEDDRPRKRSDCERGPRPCPWASCPYSLLVDVHRPRGRDGDVTAVDFEVRDRIDDAVASGHTCAHDIIDQGPMTHREIGEVLGLSAEGARLTEVVALRRVRARVRDGRLREQLDALIRISDRIAEATDHMNDDHLMDPLPEDPKERRKEICRRASKRYAARRRRERDA